MVAGHFDVQAGEDLALLVEDEIHKYFSDSVSSLNMPSVEVSPQANATGLFAGDFDGVPPSDLLVWEGTGATLDFGVATLPLVQQEVRDGAGFDYGSPGASVATATTRWR